MSAAPIFDGDTQMFVVLTGNPITGFEVCGPFDNEVEAKRAGPIASESFGFPSWCWWVLPLTPLNPGECRSVGEWRELVTHGAAYVTPKISIDGSWELNGPHEGDKFEPTLRLK